MRVEDYQDERGRRPFSDWFNRLNAVAAVRIKMATDRMEDGKFGNTKSVGGGVHEAKIDFGPGYRIYLGRDGDELVLLLGGGTKQRQSQDIATAKLRWADYKRRKRLKRGAE